jgi:hypothetical protein
MTSAANHNQHIAWPIQPLEQIPPANVVGRGCHAMPVDAERPSSDTWFHILTAVALGSAFGLDKQGNREQLTVRVAVEAKCPSVCPVRVNFRA